MPYKNYGNTPQTTNESNTYNTTAPIKPAYKDFKGLEIQVGQSSNLALQHCVAAQYIDKPYFWEKMDALTTEYFNFLNKKKKELI
jgi:hypothetical protein